MGNVVIHAFGSHSRLKELRVAHRALDAAIRELAATPDCGQLQIRRLKKEKLRLKDLIARMENTPRS